MGALYVKDDEALRLAEELAKRRGITKVAAVRLALSNELARESENKRDLLAWLDDHRRRNPLPPPTGVKADKAFFDEMWGEDP